MAWTTPKTWADGDIPDADDLNTHIKANLDVLSTHAHSGAAGDGSAALAPIATVTFANQGSTPAAPGSAKVNIFSESETLKVREGASGAAVAIALANHTHTIASSTETAANSENPGGVGTSYGGSLSVSFTPSDSTGTQHFVTVQFATATFVNASGTGGTVYLRILKAGSQIQEVSGTLTDSITGLKTLSQSYVHSQPAASGTTWAQETKKAASVGGTNVGYKTLITRQVRCQ